jgi:hypothetical protein
MLNVKSIHEAHNLRHPEKSAAAEHSINTRHQIDFSSTSVLDKAAGYVDRLVNEAIEIQLYT